MAGAVRQPIDVASLERFVASNVPEIQVPLEVKQFGYGQSNPTYQLIDKTGKKFVLRKKPPGQLLSKTAHKVDREYRIIHALENTDVPVPKAYCLCEDDSVIGTAFYIMEFLDGRIFEDPAIPGVTPEERKEMWHDAIRALAKFHRVSPKSVGLESYGKPSGFYTRQLATFATISEAQAQAIDVETKVPVGKIPHYDDMVAFFSNPKTQPKDRSSFVHGDYKIDNVVFHKTEPRIIGILDWEMSTVGHPLSDLANLITPFTTASSQKAIEIGRGSPKFQPGKTPGLPTKQECINWYTEVAGWNPASEITWGDAFGIYRGSIIMQGIAARYALRQASSAQASEYGKQMKPFAEVAWSLVEEAKGQASKSKL
ncbi:APH-domain-containing protein [Eremomyces bilateralis CBS 781.70]|uniref:APH-domain-containing protein n=1 Tax=Eremomyces bilateralis CBS 781.70 TaxID=1392243 RepID=A0A6G1G6B0_9PEZI|nr:APH-domain-containing protein [Eremomyces bilateralis CBS 781.70]KAF1813607.1 APH-domain-containing protein [Eremomyces bilateralis CBS 781.70]